MLISAALCYLQVTSASTTNMALSEEQTRMSLQGTLKYDALTEGEKTALFEKYEKNCDWKVRVVNTSHIPLQRSSTSIVHSPKSDIIA